jgi:hypothetical protein
MATVRQNVTGAGAEDVRARETTNDLKAMLGAPFLKGVAVTFDAPALASVRVPHKLGRKPVGWFVTDVTDDVPLLYREQWDASFILFNSTNACSVTLWVF